MRQGLRKKHTLPAGLGQVMALGLEGRRHVHCEKGLPEGEARRGGARRTHLCAHRMCGAGG